MSRKQLRCSKLIDFGRLTYVRNSCTQHAATAEAPSRTVDPFFAGVHGLRA